MITGFQSLTDSVPDNDFDKVVSHLCLIIDSCNKIIALFSFELPKEQITQTLRFITGRICLPSSQSAIQLPGCLHCRIKCHCQRRPKASAKQGHCSRLSSRPSRRAWGLLPANSRDEAHGSLQNLQARWAIHVSESGRAVVPGIGAIRPRTLFTFLLSPEGWSFAELSVCAFSCRSQESSLKGQHLRLSWRCAVPHAPAFSPARKDVAQRSFMAKAGKAKPVFRREKASALCHLEIPCIALSGLNDSLCKKAVFQPELGNADTCRHAFCKALAAYKPCLVSFQAIRVVASMAQEPGVAACDESLFTAERSSASHFGNPGGEDGACGISCQVWDSIPMTAESIRRRQSRQLFTSLAE